MSIEAPADELTDKFRVTLRTALGQGLALALRQGPGEIRALELACGSGDNLQIVYYEATSGSAGAVSRVLDDQVLHQVIGCALESVHYSDKGNDLEPDCADSCYECLKDYRNQREHESLDRKAIRDFLLWMRGIELQPIQSPEWEEMIAALHGPGAENERQFLRLIRDGGIALPEKKHYGIPDEGIPVAEIDFKVGRLHVLVNGSVHHVKWISDLDNAKRDALQHDGYHIFAFDMDRPDESLAKLKEML